MGVEAARGGCDGEGVGFEGEDAVVAAAELATPRAEEVEAGVDVEADEKDDYSEQN